jgi:hypothetical protein
MIWCIPGERLRGEFPGWRVADITSKALQMVSNGTKGT